MESAPWPLLFNGSINMFQQRRLCFLRGPCRGVILKTTDANWANLDLSRRPSHIAEHSPRDLESGCVDGVLALARRMFCIRAECERWCVWCPFFCCASKGARVATRGNTSDPTTHREPLSHLWVNNPNSCRVVKLQVNYSRCRIGAMN
jgi:hypothetical protein